MSFVKSNTRQASGNFISSKRILKTAFVALISVPLLNGCSNRQRQPADIEYDVTQSPYHLVKRGETLASIASTYGMDRADLAHINSLKPPFKIVSGQKLIIKTFSGKSPDPYESPAEETTTTASGDVKVNKLAPLPGTEEENTKLAQDQPFTTPDGQEAYDEGGMQDNTQEGMREEMPEEEQKPEAPKVVKTLPGTPKSASFYSWPVKGKIVKGFQAGTNGHAGIEISAAKGSPVVAANNGVVARTEQIPGYGKLILIKHDNGFVTVYGHLEDIKVKRGDIIEAGHKIGTVGKSGNVKEPQLHFQIRKNGKTPVDPTQYLD